MQYRRFGKLDWQASALGFGIMRMPTVGEDRSVIDEAQATHMVRHAIDQGVNYLDSAYVYHGGASEPFVGRVLRDGYRERVRVATKLPCWKVETAADFDPLLDEQLARLQIGPIDFYLLHGLDAESWRKMRDLGVLAWAERALADGRIRHLGFSFHDSYDVFREIVDGYDNWTMCQIQYNYMDEDDQAGVRGLQYAAARGTGRSGHGTVARRAAGGHCAGAGAGVVGCRDRPSHRGRLGTAMGVESARSVPGVERHEHAATG